MTKSELVYHSTESLPWELLLEADPKRELVEAYLEKGSLLLYKEDGHVLGELVYQLSALGQVEIMNVSVAQKAQGKGIGRRLLERAFTDIKERCGSVAVIIKTGDITSAALHLYQSVGFVEKSRVQDYFLTHYEEPIYENGELLRHQVILEKVL